MSYTKAMKWQRTHPQGTKQPVIMHTGSGFWPSQSFGEKWDKYAQALEKQGRPYLDIETYYYATMYNQEPPVPEAEREIKSINLFEIGRGYDFKAITALLLRGFGETLTEILKPQEAPENCVQLTIPAANYGRIKETIRLALPLEHYRELYVNVDGKLLKNANGFSHYF